MLRNSSHCPVHPRLGTRALDALHQHPFANIIGLPYMAMARKLLTCNQCVRHYVNRPYYCRKNLVLTILENLLRIGHFQVALHQLTDSHSLQL